MPPRPQHSASLAVHRFLFPCLLPRASSTAPPACSQRYCYHILRLIPTPRFSIDCQFLLIFCLFECDPDMPVPAIDLPAFQALVAHVFLLPSFPNQSDECLFASDLAKLLEHALEMSLDLFPEDCRDRLVRARGSITSFRKVQGDSGHIRADKLVELMQGCHGGTLLFQLHFNQIRGLMTSQALSLSRSFTRTPASLSAGATLTTLLRHSSFHLKCTT